MFPSASRIIPDEGDKHASLRTESWLQSSTYKSALDSHSSTPKHEFDTRSKLSVEDKRAEKRKKRKRHRSVTPENQLSAEPALTNDFYRIDRDCNKNIYKYSSIYEGEVAKFNTSLQKRILGFKSLRLLDLSPEALKEEAKKNRRKRYCSKRNHKRIFMLGKFITSKCKPGGPESFVPVEESSQLDSCADEIHAQKSIDLEKVAQLNRLLYNQPKNVKAWLDLIDLQLKDTEFSGCAPSKVSQKEEFCSPQRYVLLEKQIATTERALSVNSGNVRLRLLLAGLREFETELIVRGVRSSSITESSTVSQKNTVAREWSEFVFTCPQIVSVWRGYIAHLRGRFSSSTNAASVFSLIDSVYQRALTTLSGILSGRILSHKPTENMADLTVELLAEYCWWLSQTGFTERAVSLWQAAIEFSCFCPPRLKSTDYVSFEQRHTEFEKFWTSDVPRFGHPLARGWATWYSTGGVTEPPDCVPQPQVSSNLAVDLDEDWNPSSATAATRWQRISAAWNQTSEAAEDLLLNFDSSASGEKRGEAVAMETTGSAAYSGSHHPTAHPLTSSLNRKHMRGLAWLGLERTRESVGWLSACSTLSGQALAAVEDPERLVRFDEVRPCLLEVHLQPDLTESEVVRRQQRMLLLFLEFVGVWDAEVAQTYHFPPDLCMVHELSDQSFLQRQRISPRQFGFVWLRPPNQSSSSSVSCVTQRAQQALASAALEQCSLLFPKDIGWQSTIGRLRFAHMTQLFLRVLATQKTPTKTVLGTWRRRAKQLLSSPTAQTDVSMWSAFACGLAAAAHVCSAYRPADVETFAVEARRVFTSTLRMYHIALPTPPPATATAPPLRLDSFTSLLPRLQIAHRYLEFELLVGAPVDAPRPSSDTAFDRVLYLLHTVATGASVNTQAGSSAAPSPVQLAEAATLLAQSLETLKAALEAHTPTSEVDYLQRTSVQCAQVAGLLSSFLLHIQLLALDETSSETAYPVIFKYLRDMDDLHLRITSHLDAKKSRWSSEAASKASAGICMRQFLRLVLPGIAAICSFRQRNRCAVIERFLQILADFYAAGNEDQSSEVTEETTAKRPSLPPVVSPTEWQFLLPQRVAAPCLGSLSLSYTLDYQRKMQGLLPPLVLSALRSRFSDSAASVCQSVAVYLADSAHVSSVGRKQVPTDCPDAAGHPELRPGLFLGLSDHHTELLARVLPSSLDLLYVGLELERWTSLVAGSASDSFVSGDPTSHCTSLHAITRLRNTLETTLRSSPASDHLTRFESTLPSIVCTLAPSFWVDHLRTLLWSAYMAFEWTATAATAAGHAAAGTTASSSLFGAAFSGEAQQVITSPSSDAHRRQRAAVKAIFYRAIEDLPWAKILYTDFARYCPEDVEEVVELLTEAELRLRTPLDEVDLLLTSKPVNTAD
ncbi:Protein nrde2 [Sparganum proliferum]